MPWRVVKRIAGNDGSPVKVCREDKRIVHDPIHSCQCFRLSSCLGRICNLKNAGFIWERMKGLFMIHSSQGLIRFSSSFRKSITRHAMHGLLRLESKTTITLRRSTGSSNCLGKFLLRSMLFALFRPARLLSHSPSLFMDRDIKDHNNKILFFLHLQLVHICVSRVHVPCWM